MSTTATTRPPEPGPVIEAIGLRKRFGDAVAVDDLSFAVPRGSILALLGPNGAGKTTTIRLLTTLLPLEGGRAFVDGHDLSSEPDAVRRSIGLAGQSAAVDEKLTVRQNLDLFGRLYHLPGPTRRARVDELIDRFGMRDYANRLAETLSGGERRRLDLVAALIADPPAVFLDEPTTGLDPRGRLAIWEEIRAMRDAGTAVVLTTQYLEEADELADEVIIIDHGAVVASGTSAELKARLERDVLEITLADPEHLAVAMSALEQGRALTVDERTIHLSVAAPGDSLAVLRRIDEAGVELADFQLRRPTLDDVFIEIIGQHEPAVAEADVGGDCVIVLTDTLAIARRDLVRTARMPEQLTFSVIMGIFFLLLFYYVFGGIIAAGSGVDYLEFLVPGVLVITVVNGAQQTGTGLALDLSSGVVDRFRSLPMSQVAVIAGRTVADTLRNVAGVLLVVAVAYLMGYRLDSLAGAIGMLVLVVGLGYAFSWVGAWIGARIRNAETVGLLSMFWLFPLMLASSAFVPTSDMHEFVRLFAEVQPISVVSEAARALAAGQPAEGPLLASIAWIVGLSAVFAWLAGRAYRRT